MRTAHLTGRTAGIAAATTGALLATTLVTAGPAQAGPASAHRKPPAPQASKLVPVHRSGFDATFSTTGHPATPAPKVLPAGGTGAVDTSSAPTKVGGLEVRLTSKQTPAAVGTSTTSQPSAAGPVTVGLARDKAGSLTAHLTKAGGQRWAGTLTLRADQVTTPGSVDRLRAVEPTCGAGGDCEPTPVPLTRDAEAGTVSLAVTTGTTYTLAAGANGSAGDYSATGLNPATAWGVSEQFGSFTWSYPMRVPPAASGLAPDLSIGYDSASVDGRVASTNNQTSWVGEGFDLSPGGYISREYTSCADDMTGGTNATRKTADLCWSKDNATLVLDGKASRLVRDTTTGAWRAKEDNGSTLTRLTGAGNGDNDGEYWVLTDTEGTKYYFGLEKRYATDTTVRNSTLTVPVAGNQSGEPCYNTSFAAGFCNQAYKWQLSYVRDLRGNTITYNYAKETNRYGQNLDTKSVTYDRAGYLTSIEYGQVAGTETAANTQQRVLFDVGERCIPSGSITCDPAQLTTANAAYWPDVPQDQICTATTTCGAGHTAPAFFTRKRLTVVRTQVLKAGAFTDVERWNLTQSFPSPGDGTAPAMWLDQVAHTGLVGGTATTPPVLFGRTQLQNRVNVGASDGDAPLIKYRLSSIKTETGGVISVNYQTVDCTSTSLPAAPDSNTRRCFPNYWSPPGATTPVLGWFHKYLVDSVVADGALAPSQATVTRYTYLGTPAWHYDDNITQPAKYRTWSQFRGYASVDTITGETSEPNPLRQRATFYRGMNGDKLTAGGTKTVVVTDSTGATTPDQDYFNGLTREAITYNGSTEIEGSISTPWVSAATATDAYGAARIVRTDATVTGRQARDGTSPFTTRTTTTFDTTGNPTQVAEAGDTTRTDDDRCTTTSYVTNPTLNLKGLPAGEKTVAVACGATVGPNDITAETQTFYDGATTLTATPTRGEVTKTMVRADTGMVTGSTTGYDGIGRVKTSTDALGHTTSTAYTPADNQATTAVAVTDPEGFLTTTTLEAAYGIPTKTVDANARTTTISNDPLGRTAKVWLANRATYQSPSYQYSYLVRQDGASAVTTSTLHYLGSARITSTTLYDGLGRPTQTQTQSGSANRVVSETIYDTRGLAKAVRGPWVSTGLPSTTAVTAGDASVDKIVTTAYDGAARPTRATTFVYAVEKFHTEVIYHGDATDTLPPAGAAATRAVVDARGRQTQLWQYHGSTITPDKDVTAYTHDNKDQLTKVVNASGMTWTYAYNQLGQQKTAIDPDKGTTSTEYDLLGNVRKTTDAAGRVLNRTYDELNRPVQVTDATGALQTKYTYDTVTGGKGQLATATAYTAGAAYTNTIIGYDPVYHVKANTLTIPATQTGLAGSYAYTRNYNVDGSLGFVNMPAVANLPAEQYSYQRDATNLPKNLTGASAVVADSARDGFGRLTQYTLQSLDYGTFVSQTYEPGLGRLSTYRIDRDNVATPDQAATYSYDPSGQITSIADVPDPTNPARTDRQCFTYTWAGELSEAWANGASNCAPTPTLVATGAAPYWSTYGYDTAHRRATWTRHGSSTTTDVTATYTYPAATASPNGTTGGPHAAASISTKVGAGTPTVAALTYDRTGNTTSTPLPAGGTGTTTWDAQGRLATATKTGVAGATALVYGPDGNLLIRANPNGSKTLYLGGDTEITYTPAIGATPASTTAIRTYTFDGQIVAIRKATGTNGVTFQPPGYQGTSLVQTQGSGVGVVVRRYDPFGNPRGTSAGWDTNHGYLGGTGATTDTTGLVHLGAREYNPTAGAFLSVDPVMDLTDPTQWNAYSYAQNNPITLTDPDGNRPLGAGDYGCTNCKTTTTSTGHGKTAKKHTTWQFGNDENYQTQAKWSAYGQKSVYGKRYHGYVYDGGEHLPYGKITGPKPLSVGEKVFITALSFTGVGTAAGLIDGINAYRRGDQKQAAIDMATSLPGAKFLKGGKALRAAEGADEAANTTVAIGRNMPERVVPYATEHGYGYYKGTPKVIPRSLDKVAPTTLKRVDMWFNKRWINKQMGQGNRIVDIGEPPGYAPSDFYNMELDQVRGYGNYVQDIQP